MKVIKFITAMMLAVLFISPALAELYTYGYSDYDEVKDMPEFKKFIGAVGHGISTANVALYGKKRKRLFCPPMDIALNEANYNSILASFIDKKKELLKPMEDTEVDVEVFLMFALEKAMPCKEGE